MDNHDSSMNTMDELRLYLSLFHKNKVWFLYNQDNL